LLKFSHRLLIVGAGAAGGTGQSRSPTIQPPCERRRLASSAGHGSCASASLREAFRYPCWHRGLAGRSGPSLDPPDGAPGVQSLRRFAPTGRVVWHLGRTGPTCRSCPSSAPIYFRRGDLSPVGNRILMGDWPEDENASTSGLRSRLRSVSVALRCSATDRSCLGLCLLQGWRARFPVQPNRLDPVRDHQPPEIQDRFRDRVFPIRSWAFGVSFHLDMHDRLFADLEVLIAGRVPRIAGMLPRGRRPFSVLMGLMPGRSGEFYPPHRLPV
jgi:hypothetical protein